MTIFVPNFVHLLGRVLSINVLFFSEITLRIRNWHNAKLWVRILQLHIVIFTWCYVPNSYCQIYWKNCKLNSIKLICECIDVHDRQRSSKLVAVGRKRREQLTHACCAVSHPVIRLRRVQRSQLFALFWPLITTFKLCCWFSDIHTYEYV